MWMWTWMGRGSGGTKDGPGRWWRMSVGEYVGWWSYGLTDGIGRRGDDRPRWKPKPTKDCVSGHEGQWVVRSDLPS
jgi:hypothetical protein